MNFKFKITLLLTFVFLACNTGKLNVIADLPNSLKEVSCKIKGYSLKGNYSGKCKKGLAHGKGVFKYDNGKIFEGTFRKGMIHGKGELYTLNNGDKDVIKKGIWKKNKYIGEEKIVPYAIRRAFNVDKSSIKRIGEGTQVSINFFQNGSRNPVTNLSVFLTNGIEVSGSDIHRFNIIAFPVEFEINYFTRNKLNTGSYRVTYEFVINKSGNWDVTLFN